MQIQNLNKPAEGQETGATSPVPDAAIGPELSDRPGVEMALLRAQIEHLELVVETARSLMTSNQERLLRRLHDVPREMVALSARLNRLDRLDTVRRVA